MRPGQGSHRQKIAELRERGIREEDAHELRIPPRSAVVWRTQVWHCVGPNISQQDRLIMHVGCTLQLPRPHTPTLPGRGACLLRQLSVCSDNYRWMRPTDYTRQSPELLASLKDDPVRLQLLGEIPDGVDPLGTSPDTAPASAHWSDSEETVPLTAMAAALESAPRL